MDEREKWERQIALSKLINTILFDARSFLAVDPGSPFNDSYSSRAISLISLKRVVEGVSKLPQEFLDSHSEFPWERMIQKWDRIANGGPFICNAIVHYDVASDLYRMERILKAAI